jgi:LacI family transcriptional regulator
MQVDAVIFTAGGLRDPDSRATVEAQLESLRSTGTAIVRLAPHGGGQPDVGFSNEEGLRLAVDHLVGLGHTRLGFVRGPEHVETAVERLEAMRAALGRHRLALASSDLFDGGFSRDDGECAADRYIDTGCGASAIVCANDQAAIGFMRRLRERGVFVPADVSVMGYDDIAPCRYVDPPLTTVHVPLYDLGVSGMRVALELLGGSDDVEPVRLPLSLSIRSSTSTVRNHEVHR